MSDSAIEFASLSKVYSFGFWGKRQTALNKLTLSVPKGSIYGFLGGNGAGKTTAIKIFMGLQFATSGTAKIFGRENTDPEAKARVGYLPERPYFHDSMAAHEFLNFHRNLFGGTLVGKKLQPNDELLKIVGLTSVGAKALKDYSKGMLQRIGIAQALINDPDLVVLDEPTSGLDPIGRRDVRDLILRLSDAGKTIFFSSHILADVESICHRIAFLEKGVLKCEGGLQEILKFQRGSQELQFQGVDQLACAKHPALLEAKKMGETMYLKCESEAATKAAIEAIWKLGGKLISCQAEQHNLEEFLFGKEAGK